MKMITKYHHVSYFRIKVLYRVVVFAETPTGDVEVVANWQVRFNPLN